MSVRNTLAYKRFARYVREHKRQNSTIPHGGVIVDKTMVRQHRYLRGHGLPHSSTVASVFIGH